MRSYTKMNPGDDGWTHWVQPIEKGYKMACCDCGLVHDMEFKVEDGRAEFRAARNNRATGQARRHMKRNAT